MGLVTVSFKVEAELLEKVDALARERGKSRSIIIREALERYIGNTDDPPYNMSIGITDDKMELIEWIRLQMSQLIEACKEKRRRIQNELSLSPYELYKLPELAECRKVNRTISELLRMNMEA